MLFLSAHNARAVAALCVLAAALSALAARIVIPVDLAVFDPPRDIPLIELLAVVYGGVAAGLTAPRIVEWEKLGTTRVSVFSAALVLAVTGLAQLVVFAGVAVLPGEAPWQYVPANVAVFTAIACLARGVLGPITAPVLTLLLFLACCVVQNTLPDVGAWLPLSRPNGTPLPPVVALVAVALAIAATAHNRGMTMWAYSRNRD
ncbi:hypothetical protein JOF56_008499 [Kibdelosporangium banguiense]|uniref:Uncharacterized protein n=1 Tax=Kibdelosporangium banguiense TaxID=1365924 RepID=A0ABS4TUL7_9PSEU|nr:hypothetical protein [Kibdelosporangium banguiense]MBP2328114.1 hypothetical protein [Kibdelosporangium banguiense]